MEWQPVPCNCMRQFAATPAPGRPGPHPQPPAPDHPPTPCPHPPRCAALRSHNHSFHRAWLGKHIDESGSQLKKPILIEEFGKILGR